VFDFAGHDSRVHACEKGFSRERPLRSFRPRHSQVEGADLGTSDVKLNAIDAPARPTERISVERGGAEHRNVNVSLRVVGLDDLTG
jgi:hypothetical protein